MIGMTSNKIKTHIQVLKKYSSDEKITFVTVIIDYMVCRIFHGYCLEDYVYNSYGSYTSNIYRRRFFSFKRWKFILHYNNKNGIAILDNKIAFLKFFHRFIKHDWIYPKESSLEEFNNFLLTHEHIICKPVKSIYGLGVSLFRKNDPENKYVNICKNDLFLEEQIKQHHSLSFGSKSVNTIRVYSMLDKSNNVHILKSILRVGTGGSIVDNFHSGGVIYPINIEYGIIESYGLQRESNKKIFYHPGTSQCMLGYKIPSWEKILGTVREAHAMLPEVRYIGWDIVVMYDGEIDIIEANSNADHALFSRVGIDRLFYHTIKELL